MFKMKSFERFGHSNLSNSIFLFRLWMLNITVIYLHNISCFTQFIIKIFMVWFFFRAGVVAFTDLFYTSGHYITTLYPSLVNMLEKLPVFHFIRQQSEQKENLTCVSFKNKMTFLILWELDYSPLWAKCSKYFFYLEQKHISVKIFTYTSLICKK